MTHEHADVKERRVDSKHTIPPCVSAFTCIKKDFWRTRDGEWPAFNVTRRRKIANMANVVGHYTFFCVVPQ